jgi:hypothetical protein
MNISAACPSCGAALDIDEQTARVICPFCGTSFELDLSKANPELLKSTPRSDSANVIVPDDSDILTPPAPGTETPGFYQPVQPDAFSLSPDQPFTLPFIAQSATRLVGTRLWFGLAIATIVIFCLSCVCLLAVVRLIFSPAG